MGKKNINNVTITVSTSSSDGKQSREEVDRFVKGVASLASSELPNSKVGIDIVQHERVTIDANTEIR